MFYLLGHPLLNSIERHNMMQKRKIKQHCLSAPDSCRTRMRTLPELGLPRGASADEES
jgi:hypothetical protein